MSLISAFGWEGDRYLSVVEDDLDSQIVRVQVEVKVERGWQLRTRGWQLRTPQEVRWFLRLRDARGALKGNHG